MRSGATYSSSARHSRVTRRSLTSDSSVELRALAHIEHLVARSSTSRHVSNHVSRNSHVYFNLLVLSSIAPTVAVILPSLSCYRRCPPTVEVLLQWMSSHRRRPGYRRSPPTVAILLPSQSSYRRCPRPKAKRTFTVSLQFAKQHSSSFVIVARCTIERSGIRSNSIVCELRASSESRT